MTDSVDLQVNTIIVVPVYNEEKRLQAEAFINFVEQHQNSKILFANDGSIDGTQALLDRICRHPSGRITHLNLTKNSGKAEAVRTGVANALAQSGIEYVGYLDADLSTPVTEMVPFIDLLKTRPGAVMVLGSRVKLLGRKIKRRLLRHYLGRVFATVASIVLDIGVYDTQCGAKLFRSSAAVKAIFAEPFSSRWIFDVEIIARLARELGVRGPELEATMIECPLGVWQDVGGSKVKAKDFFVAFLEMLSLHLRYQKFLR
ncbi:MAG: glycosyltransferase [Deltaproteobacteria bacterium]|nr:glycosyltransferase [Deltaproteobacteria bacterium]